MKKRAYKLKNVIIYGVWSLKRSRLEKVSLSEEEMEMELLIAYNEDTHCLVKMPVTLMVPEVKP